MNHSKRLARAKRKAKAMRLARWQGVPYTQGKHSNLSEGVKS